MVDFDDPRAAAALDNRIGWAGDRDRRVGCAIACRMDILKIDAWRKCDHRAGLRQIDRLLNALEWRAGRSSVVRIVAGAADIVVRCRRRHRTSGEGRDQGDEQRSRKYSHKESGEATLDVHTGLLVLCELMAWMYWLSLLFFNQDRLNSTMRRPMWSS